AVVMLLHLVVPARTVDGYAVNPQTKQPYRYRLNGLIVYALTIGLWAGVCSAGGLSWNFFWVTRLEGLAGACVFGLLFTLFVLVLRCVLVLRAAPAGTGLLAGLCLGRAEHPQWLGGRVDAKMWYYLVGATMLGLHLYSFAVHHRLMFPADPSPGVTLYVALF